jgi:hypothetical protein
MHPSTLPFTFPPVQFYHFCIISPVRSRKMIIAKIPSLCYHNHYEYATTHFSRIISMYLLPFLIVSYEDDIIISRIMLQTSAGAGSIFSADICAWPPLLAGGDF